MKLIDSHTHLNADDLYSTRQDYLSQFVDAGGVGLINSWASDEYNTRWLEIAKTMETWKDGKMETLKHFDSKTLKHLVVKSTIGYHPDSCNNGEITEENIQQKISDLKTLYEANKQYIVAIGECGIDTYYPGSEETLPLQKKLFTLQCDLAKALDLPLMVHIRKDFDSAFEILQNYRDMIVYIHCWGFGSEEVKRLQVAGSKLWRRLFVWFCGNVTYKNAQNLRDALAMVPLDQLFLETDAPWLSPQIVRGTTNAPVNVKYIYEFVAEYLHISPEVLEKQIEENFHILCKTQ